MNDSKDRARTLAWYGLVLGLLVPSAYFAIRLSEHVRGGVVDPLAAIRSRHIAYFYRLPTAIWLGAVAAWPASQALARSPHRLGEGSGVPAAVIVLGALGFAWIAFEVP